MPSAGHFQLSWSYSDCQLVLRLYMKGDYAREGRKRGERVGHLTYLRGRLIERKHGLAVEVGPSAHVEQLCYADVVLGTRSSFGRFVAAQDVALENVHSSTESWQAVCSDVGSGWRPGPSHHIVARRDHIFRTHPNPDSWLEEHCCVFGDQFGFRKEVGSECFACASVVVVPVSHVRPRYVTTKRRIQIFSQTRLRMFGHSILDECSPEHDLSHCVIVKWMRFLEDKLLSDVLIRTTERDTCALTDSVLPISREHFHKIRSTVLTVSAVFWTPWYFKVTIGSGNLSGPRRLTRWAWEVRERSISSREHTRRTSRKDSTRGRDPRSRSQLNHSRRSLVPLATLSNLQEPLTVPVSNTLHTYKSIMLANFDPHYNHSTDKQVSIAYYLCMIATVDFACLKRVAKEQAQTII